MKLFTALFIIVSMTVTGMVNYKIGYENGSRNRAENIANDISEAMDCRATYFSIIVGPNRHYTFGTFYLGMEAAKQDAAETLDNLEKE